MGLLAAGQVVSLLFPYSDLSGQKVRPALLLAFAGRRDWIACQITTNPYADPLAIELNIGCFGSGSLAKLSYLRPGKLFTANEKLISKSLGVIHGEVLAAARIRISGLILEADSVRSILQRIQ